MKTLDPRVLTEKNETLINFLVRPYSVYTDLHLAYLQINPLVFLGAVDGENIIWKWLLNWIGLPSRSVSLSERLLGI